MIEKNVYVVPKNKTINFTATQLVSIVTLRSPIQDTEKVINDLDDMSTISTYILLFGVALMMLSLFYNRIPWVLSAIPIFGALSLNLVSLLGRHELRFYYKIHGEEIYISGYVYGYSYSDNSESHLVSSYYPDEELMFEEQFSEENMEIGILNYG